VRPTTLERVRSPAFEPRAHFRAQGAKSRTDGRACDACGVLSAPLITRSMTVSRSLTPGDWLGAAS
jgi:hypothetical protein